MKGDDTLILVFVAIVMLALGWCMGDASRRDGMRREAIKNGVAEWIANESGDAEFQWKTNSSAPSSRSSEEDK